MVAMNLGSVARTLVGAILSEPLAHSWTLQGFGMLRLHIDGEYRVNIWDGHYRVPNVSLMHTHPWNFASLVICGRLTNVRYRQALSGGIFHAGMIKPGPGGGRVEDLPDVILAADEPEFYTAGDVYSQQHHEIHVSNPEDGTVTLNRRVRTGEDVAAVYWPCGQQWVSAEPRVATVDEVLDITARARRLL